MTQKLGDSLRQYWLRSR